MNNPPWAVRWGILIAIITFEVAWWLCATASKNDNPVFALGVPAGPLGLICLGMWCHEQGVKQARADGADGMRQPPNSSSGPN
jgi:hypothetical protein